MAFFQNLPYCSENAEFGRNFGLKFPSTLLVCFNPFPHDKILDQTKLNAFADDKLNVTKMLISVIDRVDNIVGKGEMACTMFLKGFFPRCVKRCHCVDTD